MDTGKKNRLVGSNLSWIASSFAVYVRSINRPVKPRFTYRRMRFVPAADVKVRAALWISYWLLDYNYPMEH